MKNFKNYLIEKFVINKNTKSSTPQELIDKYGKGQLIILNELIKKYSISQNFKDIIKKLLYINDNDTVYYFEDDNISKSFFNIVIKLTSKSLTGHFHFKDSDTDSEIYIYSYSINQDEYNCQLIAYEFQPGKFCNCLYIINDNKLLDYK